MRNDLKRTALHFECARWSFRACTALAMLGTACDPGRLFHDPSTPPRGKPVLVHSGVDIKAYAQTHATESVWVANADPGEWQVSLLSAPPSSWLSGNRIYYFLDEGLSGPQSVHVLATRDTARLEATWTILAYPEPNRPPVLEVDPRPPLWGRAGDTIRTRLQIHDPEGDSIAFHAELPPGAVLRDSVLEWILTPSPSERAFLRLTASDFFKTSSLTFQVMVFTFDPKTWAAEPIPGRTWFIHGFTRTRPRASSDKKLVDSTWYRRSVTIIEGEPGLGNVSLRILDTLSGSRSGIRDTTIQIALPDGSGWPITEGVGGMLPFAWPSSAMNVLDSVVHLGDRTLAARRELITDVCLRTFFFDDGCAADVRVFAAGVGLAYYRKDGFKGAERLDNLEEFRVWGMSDP